MPRSFDLEVESSASVEQFHSACGREDYWRARLAANDAGTATLDSLILDDGGAVNITTTHSLVRDRLPRLVLAFCRGDLELVHNETWSRIGGGRVRGRISGTVPGAPMSALGAVMLTPVRNGSRLECTGTVEVRIPLVGAAIERFISREFANGVRATQHFTTAWIAANG